MGAVDGKIPDLVIVSAFGRGNWLAMETAANGWRTSLIDVTSNLAPMAPEDAEGPFGLTETPTLLASQLERVRDEGELLESPAGLVLWLKDGPIEFRSHISEFVLERKGVPADVDQYLRHPDTKAGDRRSLLKRPFRETWLAHFAHTIAASVHGENFEGLKSGEAWPLFHPFSIRQVTGEGLARGLKLCQERGVRVRSQAKIEDVRFTGKTMDVIEVRDEKTGVEKGRAFLWMLTSGECHRSQSAVSANAAKALFPAGPLQTSWRWMRQRFQVEGIAVDQIPVHAICVNDPYLPWTHANVVVVRRTREMGVIDVWSRWPSTSAPTAEVRERLVERFPGTQITEIGSPSGGPEVATTDALANLQMQKAANVFFCSPETWDFLDWYGQYRNQTKILEKLTRMKAQWDAADAKLAAREAAKRGGPNPPSGERSP